LRRSPGRTGYDAVEALNEHFAASPHGLADELMAGYSGWDRIFALDEHVTGVDLRDHAMYRDTIGRIAV
jgi:hypothetical protein